MRKLTRGTFVMNYCLLVVLALSLVSQNGVASELWATPSSRDIPCFTCPDKTVKIDPLVADAPREVYEGLVETGHWRVGRWVYTPCPSCQPRLCRVSTKDFAEHYFDANAALRINQRRWKAKYKNLYKALKVEFRSIDEFDEAIFQIFCHSKASHAKAPAQGSVAASSNAPAVERGDGSQKSSSEDESSADDRSEFAADFMTSTVGSVDDSHLLAMNKGDFSTHPRGTMFVTLMMEKQLIAVLVLDIRKNWLGFKTFWNKNPIALQDKAIFTSICWFKCFEIAHLLKLPYVIAGYYDVANKRLQYKLKYRDLMQINARNDGNWVAAKDIMDVEEDANGNCFLKNKEAYLESIAELSTK